MKSKQDGFSIVEIILLLVLVGMCGFIGWYVWDANRPTQSEDLQSSTTKPQNSANPEETGSTKQFKSTLGGFTITYPASWSTHDVPATEYVDGSSPDERFVIKSKTGFKIQYVLSEDDPVLKLGQQQLTPDSCGAQSYCPLYVVDSIEKITLKNLGEVQLLRMGTNKKIESGIHRVDPGYSIVLIKPESAAANLKVGINNLGTSMLDFTIPGKGKDMLVFSVDFPNRLNSKTAAEVFSSTDAKASEQILKSITFD